MKTISARYAGDCRACHERIRKGDQLGKDSRLGWVHANCASPAVNNGDRNRAPDRFDMDVEDRMAETCGLGGFGRED